MGLAPAISGEQMPKSRDLYGVQRNQQRDAGQVNPSGAFLRW
jgi:hypothetical protein